MLSNDPIPHKVGRYCGADRALELGSSALGTAVKASRLPSAHSATQIAVVDVNVWSKALVATRGGISMKRMGILHIAPVK